MTSFRHSTKERVIEVKRWFCKKGEFKNQGNVPFLLCITNLYLDLFYLFLISCTSFHFGHYTRVYTWFLCLFYFWILAASLLLNCRTAFYPLLNKDRTFSFFPLHQLYLFRLFVIGIIAGLAFTWTVYCYKFQRLL